MQRNRINHFLLIKAHTKILHSLWIPITHIPYPFKPQPMQSTPLYPSMNLHASTSFSSSNKRYKIEKQRTRQRMSVMNLGEWALCLIKVVIFLLSQVFMPIWNLILHSPLPLKCREEANLWNWFYSTLPQKCREETKYFAVGWEEAKLWNH